MICRTRGDLQDARRSGKRACLDAREHEIGVRLPDHRADRRGGTLLRDQWAAEIQGPTPDADRLWSEHVAGLVEPTLFPLAKSWYYPGGLPSYQQQFAESKDKGYAGFTIS